MVADGISQRGIALHQIARHLDGFVGGIVEHLNVELLPRIFQLADRLQQPLDHVLLIENGQLHRDARQVLEVRRRFRGAIVSVLVIQIHQNVAVHPVTGQQDQHNEIRDQQRSIECIGVIEPLKSLIQQMLAEIVPNALRGGPCGQRRRRDEISSQQKGPVKAFILPDSPLFVGYKPRFRIAFTSQRKIPGGRRLQNPTLQEATGGMRLKLFKRSVRMKTEHPPQSSGSM